MLHDTLIFFVLWVTVFLSLCPGLLYGVFPTKFVFIFVAFRRELRLSFSRAQAEHQRFRIKSSSDPSRCTSPAPFPFRIGVFLCSSRSYRSLPSAFLLPWIACRRGLWSQHSEDLEPNKFLLHIQFGLPYLGENPRLGVCSYRIAVFSIPPETCRWSSVTSLHLYYPDRVSLVFYWLKLLEIGFPNKVLYWNKRKKKVKVLLNFSLK
jgi:hypothetical protein